MTSDPSNLPIKVAALYRFARFERFAEFRQPLVDLTSRFGIKGTLLLASEGINGTVAGNPNAIAALIDFLDAIPELDGMEIKYSHALTMPFHRMKVRLKKEIVTMGAPGIDPLKAAGTYVEPKDWNALIADPQTVVIDTRNDYEIKVGTFTRAVDPQTKTFTEFPDWLSSHKSELEGKTLALFCTGGIRCEKATAFAKEIGLKNVHHLKGGILAYLEQVPAERSLWEGECFVFDERVTVGHGLALGDAVLCRACRTPLTELDRKDPYFVEGLSCPHCHGQRTEKDRARYAERQKQVLLAKKRGERHIGS
ncbi:MAG: rhodanese-related sulfurtransferase [Rhizobiaceae bacterium]